MEKLTLDDYAKETRYKSIKKHAWGVTVSLFDDIFCTAPILTPLDDTSYALLKEHLEALLMEVDPKETYCFAVHHKDVRVSVNTLYALKYKDYYLRYMFDADEGYVVRKYTEEEFHAKFVKEKV
jgi:hypothetical protein